MLSKLFKYEIKATARLFIPLYIVLLIFAIFNRLFSVFNMDSIDNAFLPNMTSGIIMTVYVTLMVGTFVMTLVVLIQRFYKSLLGNEGYLMFTLPVQTWKHILNKLVISMMWVVSSSLVAILSIFLIIPVDIDFAEFMREMSLALEQAKSYFGNGIYLLGFESIIIGVLSLASGILMIYGAIALGHLVSKHKLLASFGMYILLNTISQSIMAVYVWIIDRFYILPSIETFASTQIVILFMLAYLIITTVAYFILTQFILKHKLNLE